MFAGIRDLIKRLGRTSRHPALEHLLNWQEGELDERSMAVTTTHVLACSKCRSEAGIARHVMYRASKALVEAVRVPSAEAGKAGLLAALNDQRRVDAARRQVMGENDASLVARLQPFLGAYPSALLARSENRNTEFRREILHVTEVLLGRKAALSLMARHDFEMKRARG